MKISTKGRYALRMMLDIAQQGEGAVVPLKDIAQRQGISVKYQEQIVLLMNRAGFLQSVRGAQGGYLLAKRPEEYSVGDILRAIEGNLAPVACLEDSENRCGQCHDCETLWFWEGLDQTICDYVDRFTLADFLQRAKHA